MPWQVAEFSLHDKISPTAFVSIQQQDIWAFQTQNKEKFFS